MADFPIQDTQGNLIGSMSLFDKEEEIQDLLMNEVQFELGCSYSWTDKGDKKFMGYLLIPMPAVPRLETRMRTLWSLFYTNYGWRIAQRFRNLTNRRTNGN